MRLGQIGGLGSDTKISGRDDKYCFWMFIWIFQDISWMIEIRKSNSHLTVDTKISGSNAKYCSQHESQPDHGEAVRQVVVD